MLQRVRAYGVATVTVVLGLLITWEVPAFRERTPFLLVLGAAIVSAYYGGLGPGLFATFVGSLATDYFLVPPLRSAVLDEGDLQRLGLCLVLGVMTSYMSDAVQRAVVQREELLRHAEEARIAAEAANRAKDEFLAMVSHELRSPLAAIRMWATVLRGGKLPPEQAGRALRAIEEGTVTQARLVGDLLDVSRIVSGKLRLEFRAVDLAEAARTALDAGGAPAADKRIHLEVALVPSPMWADPARLQQIVSNLLANAIKFTPEGGRIDVRLETFEGQARLTVSDDGEGIPAELLPHVFERFRQGESADAARHGGLGLGLAIVRHLVEAHAGTVEVRSAGRGRGATFIVTLPLRADREASPVQSVGTPVGARLQGVVVLVVDDDRDARDAVAAVLEGSGARVRAVGSASAAIAALGTEMADVLVSDLAMSGEDGYGLIGRLRETGIAIPAAALTACTAADDRRRALAVGFQAHLAKPVDAAELVDVVARLGAGAVSATS